MKKLVFILFLFSLPCSAQYSYDKIIEVDSIVKEDLFNRAKFWAMKYYKNPERVIVAEDINHGFIKLRTGFQFDFSKGTYYSTYYNYDIELYFKDGRIKLIFANFLSEKYGLYKENQEYPFKIYSKAEKRKTDAVMEELGLKIKLQVATIYTTLEESLNNPLETEKEW